MKLVAFNCSPSHEPAAIMLSDSVPSYLPASTCCKAQSLCCKHRSCFFLGTSWHKSPNDILPFDVLLELALSSWVGEGFYVHQGLAVVCDAQTAQQWPAGDVFVVKVNALRSGVDFCVLQLLWSQESPSAKGLCWGCCSCWEVNADFKWWFIGL